LLAIRDDAFDILGATAPSFTVDTIDEPFDPNNIFRRVDGTFQVPLYLEDGGVPGSVLRVDDQGVPFNEGDFFTANYRCIIPYAATTGGGAPAVPARAALYGHGLLGTESQTSSSHVRDFSSEHNFVICGTAWTGFAEEDADTTVLAVLANFTCSTTGTARAESSVVCWRRLPRTSSASCSACPASTTARCSTAVFGELLSINYPSAMDRTLLFAAAQILWDRTDPSGHINHVTSDPYPDTPVKKLLYHVAFSDHQVAPVTAEVAARSNGARLHTPALLGTKVVPEVTPFYDIPAIPAYPYDGSALVIWDSGNPAPPIGNVPPAVITEGDPEWADLMPCPKEYSGDPHECPRRQPEARLQKSEFLKSNGAVVDVCGGAACLAPLGN
jgi:hypothetical protein